MWITAIILTILLAAGVYLYPIVRYAMHQTHLKGSLEENVCQDFPIVYGKNNHFLIDCLINKGSKSRLIIDTKAVGLMRADSISKHGGEFWGKAPFKSSNAYNEKMNIEFHSFHSFQFGSVQMKEVLFMKIDPDNTIYDILNQGVFGSDILSIGSWKFDTDQKRIRLFHSTNQTVMQKESEGLVKIENGLKDDAIALGIGDIPTNFAFTLDLGYGGVIEINNELAALLKQKYNSQQIQVMRSNESVDALTIFENIPIRIAGMEVDSCQLVNIKSANGNYIGAKFMQNLNFLLHYGEKEGHLCKELYLGMNQQAEKVFRTNYISKFGLCLGNINKRSRITSLLQNSIAERAGLVLGDEITEVIGASKEFLLSDDLENEFINYTEQLEELQLLVNNERVVTLTIRRE